MNTKYGQSRPSPEELLDQYIDFLNEKDFAADDLRKKELKEHQSESELFSFAQALKSNAADPSPEFVASLWQKIKPIGAGSSSPTYWQENREKESSRKFPKKLISWTGLVASLLAFLLLISPWSGSQQNIVLAMGESVKKLDNYHGVLEKYSLNEAGERQLLMRTEIWTEGDKYATKTQEGILTVNNGKQHWQLNPLTKEVTLLPVYLDPHDFDLQKEAAKALRYPHKILGEETIAGYPATQIEIQPPGGLAYSLWIDRETNLPIQLKTAQHKSIQTIYTYLSLETNISLSADLFQYNPPQDYKIIDQNPDKPVNSLTEALNISGLTPLELAESPRRIFASENRIAFDYGDTVVIQTKATKPLIPDPIATLGQAKGSPLEILPNSLRWQQEDLEILVQGDRAKELATLIAPDLDFQPQVANPPEGTMIPVEVDLEVVRNNQLQVDGGSSPWQLDPLQVAYTFAALKISPEGITGETPLDYSDLQLIQNDGKKALVEISTGPVKTVYLERLLRHDQTGVWTVTGYIPR